MGGSYCAPDTQFDSIFTGFYSTYDLNGGLLNHFQVGGRLQEYSVEKILVDDDEEEQQQRHQHDQDRKIVVRRVRLANGDILTSRLGVVSDCGFGSTLKLLPTQARKRLQRLETAVEKSSGGISHVFTFVGLNASHEELNLKSSSYYYIPGQLSS